MRFIFLGIWLLALPTFAAEPVSLRNDREGTTFYSSSSDERAVARAVRQVEPSLIVRAFDELMQDVNESKLCSFDLNYGLEKKLKSFNRKFSEMEGAIIYLRTQNEFDDVVAKILLSANQVVKTDIALPKKSEELSFPSKKTLAASIETVRGFEKKSKNLCFDEAFKNFYGDILKVDKTLDSDYLEAILVEAYRKKAIGFDLYLKLEQSRTSELEKSSLTLKSYYKKVKTIRTQFPLRDASEQSNFITQKVEQQKMSRRQRLLEGYSDLQIMMMADIIKKLRVRVEATKVEILIYDRSNGIETITLDAMERFRLAIKLLRKEMALLSLNTYFAGRSPDYLDIMSAAYEVGLVPASEIEEVAGLEEVWNPKKSFWDKASTWVRTLGSVATVALPPPYGFIPALTIVIIEMTVGKNNKNNNEDPSVLF
jgi:hypothetical protein